MSTLREKELAICNFLMKICSKERFIEIKRQMLSEKPDFEPYVGFRRIARKTNSDGIDSKALLAFFEENLVEVTHADCYKIITHYSSRDPKVLNFRDFLNMILPKENPELRAFVSQKDVYEIQDNEFLQYETEISLALLLEKEANFFRELAQELKILKGLNIYAYDMMRIIDATHHIEINFDNMYALFRKNNLMPYDEELISFLRRLDKDDDGVITLEELDEFLRLVPDELIAVEFKDNISHKTTSMNKNTQDSTMHQSKPVSNKSQKWSLAATSVDQFKKISPNRNVVVGTTSPEVRSNYRNTVTISRSRSRESQSNSPQAFYYEKQPVTGNLKKNYYMQQRVCSETYHHRPYNNCLSSRKKVDLKVIDCSLENLNNKSDSKRKRAIDYIENSTSRRSNRSKKSPYSKRS